VKKFFFFVLLVIALAAQMTPVLAQEGEGKSHERCRDVALEIGFSPQPLSWEGNTLVTAEPLAQVVSNGEAHIWMCGASKSYIAYSAEHAESNLYLQSGEEVFALYLLVETGGYR